MSLVVVLLLVAAVVFVVEAWLHRNLVALGLFLVSLGLLVQAGGLHL